MGQVRIQQSSGAAATKQTCATTDTKQLGLYGASGAKAQYADKPSEWWYTW